MKVTPQRRLALAGCAALFVATAAAVALVLAAGGGSSESSAPAPVSTTTVQRTNLVQRDTESGRLGFGGDRPAMCRLSGTVTWLPGVGRVIRRGRRLLSVDSLPVWLMYGSLPAWRELRRGVSDGEDVRQLERNLAALGFTAGGTMAVDDRFTAATAQAYANWQAANGLRRTGIVQLGRIVFLPGPRRVGQLRVQLGSTVGGGGAGGAGKSGGSPVAVMETTSTRRVVTVKLDAAKQTLARTGAAVTITLPDGSFTRGRITSVGKVATTSPGGQDGSGGKTTVTVTIRPSRRRRLGGLDQAPVSVGFIRERRRHVLAVPVTALLATAGGGYAVAAVDRHGRQRQIRVTTGLFANGYVEIRGAGIRAGLRVADAQ